MKQEQGGAQAQIEWQWADFAALDGHALYAMLALRSRVFVVEQQCIYEDIDGLDPQARHLLGWGRAADGQRDLLACLRVLPPGLKFAEASLGRVVSAPQARGQGLGRALLQQALQGLAVQGVVPPIRIAAQHYLQQFYAGFGFVPCSGVYDEDGIPHLDMLRAASPA